MTYDALAFAAAVAMRSLSAEVKQDRQRRAEVYNLKNRLIEAFWREGYCVEAQLTQPGMWYFIFGVEGYRFAWHQPSARVAFSARALRHPSALRSYYDPAPERSFAARRDAVKRYLKMVGG